MRHAPSAFFVIAAFAWSGLGVATASAADLSGHPVIEEGSLIPEEIGTGWYLRGDIGYGFNDVGSISHNNVDFGGVSAKDGFFGSVGFGYQFTDMVRADLTVDKINNFDLKGSASCSAWSGACTGPTSERSTISAIAVMANAYADLGTWYGVTPYVGAGIGAAYVDVSDHGSANATGVTARTFGGYETWALAANVAAGASYTISEGLMVDLGYRFLWIDGGRSGGSTAGSQSGSVEVKDLTQHQVRAGLRYYLF